MDSLVPEIGADNVPPVTMVGPADDDAESALVDGGGLIEKLPWSHASCSGGRGEGKPDDEWLGE